MKDAVSLALSLFATQSQHAQRRLVLITDGHLMLAGSHSPCDLRANLDLLGVAVLIIGVGSSWTRERID